MATALEHALWGYHHAAKLSSEDYPYEYGGGHPTPYLPWVKWNSAFTQIEPAKGPDCSGGVINILWYAGVLGSPYSVKPFTGKIAENTEWLETYGDEGPGKYITIAVLDEPKPQGIHHCFMRFTNLNQPHEWWAATDEDGSVGWQDAWGEWILEGYHLRHPAGL